MEVANAKYKAEKDKHRHRNKFQEGDLMMVRLWRRLFHGILAKLEKWKHSPFQVAQKINDNAYVLQLPDD